MAAQRYFSSSFVLYIYIFVHICCSAQLFLVLGSCAEEEEKKRRKKANNELLHC